MKIKPGYIEFTLTEMGQMLGGKVCPTCGTLHPMPLWALASHKCPTCLTWTTKANAFKGGV